MRDLVTDLQLIKGTRGIISLLSAREPVLNHEIIRSKLLSEDGQLMLIVLALAPDIDIVASNRWRDVIGEIQTTIDDDLTGTGLTTRLSGVPVMQLEIRNALERDRLLYNAFDFTAGALIAILFSAFIHDHRGWSTADRDRDGSGVLGWLDFVSTCFSMS